MTHKTYRSREQSENLINQDLWLRSNSSVGFYFMPCVELEIQGGRQPRSFFRYNKNLTAEGINLIARNCVKKSLKLDNETLNTSCYT